MITKNEIKIYMRSDNDEGKNDKNNITNTNNDESTYTSSFQERGHCIQIYVSIVLWYCVLHIANRRK